MHPKPFIFSAFLAFALSGGTLSRAQAVRVSDPGISIHNYKHPNKASAARTEQMAGFVLNSSDPALEARFARLDVGRNQSDPTPKYASRPVTFVVFTTQHKQKAGINPLTSTRHYKTGSGLRAAKTVREEWLCGTM